MGHDVSLAGWLAGMELSLGGLKRGGKEGCRDGTMGMGMGMGICVLGRRTRRGLATCWAVVGGGVAAGSGGGGGGGCAVARGGVYELDTRGEDG